MVKDYLKYGTLLDEGDASKMVSELQSSNELKLGDGKYPI